MQTRLYVLLIAPAVIAATATDEEVLRRYCGFQLANKMQELCNAMRNGSEIHQTDSEIPDNSDLDYDTIILDYLLRYERETNPLEPSSLRTSSKSRIDDECCKKPCYLSELRSYCPK